MKQRRRLSVRCSRCDYDLRGLDPAGRCPECGTKVRESIRAALRRERRQASLFRVIPTQLGIFAVLTLAAPFLLWYDHYCVFWYQWLPVVTGAYLIITSVVLRVRYSCPISLIAAASLVCGLVAIVSYGINQQLCYGFGV